MEISDSKTITETSVSNWTELFDRDIYVAWVELRYSDGTTDDVKIGFSREYTVNNGGLDKVKAEMGSTEFVSRILERAAMGYPDTYREGAMVLVKT